MIEAFALCRAQESDGVSLNVSTHAVRTRVVGAAQDRHIHSADFLAYTYLDWPFSRPQFGSILLQDLGGMPDLAFQAPRRTGRIERV